MNLWALEFRPARGRSWINHHTIRQTRREAWQAGVDLQPGEAWWTEFHQLRDAGRIVAVKVRLVKQSAAGMKGRTDV